MSDGSCTLCPEGTIPADDGTSCLPVDADQIQQTGDNTEEGENILRTYAILDTSDYCPPGFRRSSSGPNYYCEECGTGTYCLNNAQTRCSDPQFSDGMSGVCFSPPIGYSRSDGVYKRCAFGQYGSGGSCSSCPEKYSCSTNSTNTSLCTNGTYSPLGSSVCLPIPGEFDQNTNVLELCGAGSYSTGTGCKVCESGFYCPDGVSRFRCESGMAPTTGALSCAPCGQGQYHNGTKCLGCPSKTFNNLLGSVSCLSCTPFGTCSASSKIPTLCDVSKYLLNGVCEPIPAGSYRSSPSSIAPCPAGSYSPGNQPNCSICPPMYYCGKGASAYTDCGPGYYSREGESKCSICEPGFSCTNAGGRVQCEQGTYSGPGSSTCTECPAGRYCPKGFQTNNSYVNYFSTGSGIGIQCPPGYYCEEKSSVPKKCVLGTKNSDWGAQAPGNCLQCSPGEFCPPGSDAPQKCPDGYYCEGGEVKACQDINGKGAYRPVGTSGKKEDCIVCPAGYFCQRGAVTFFGNECPEGRYCLEGTNTADLVRNKCAAGYYYPYRGLKSANECTSLGSECPMGHYCPAGSAHPVKCPIGTYGGATKLVAAGSCTSCPSGRRCDSPGLVAPSEACPAGFYCIVGTGVYSMNPCPVGSYSDTIGLKDATGCKDCPAGYVCAQGSTSETMEKCPPGYYCAGGNVPITEPFIRPRSVRSEDEEDDSYTESVTQLEEVEETSGVSLSARARGGRPTACAKGTYNPIYGATKVEDCINCPAGYYCDSANTTMPINECEPGNYCAEGSFKLETCPAGTFNLNKRAKSLSECEPCPKGYHCPKDGTVYPLLCSPGSYNDKTNATGCSTCPEGYYCNGNMFDNTVNNTRMLSSFVYAMLGPESVTFSTYGFAIDEAETYENFFEKMKNFGTIDPFPCQKGLYSYSNETECRPCLAGYFCYDNSTDTGVSYSVMREQLCPAGSYCPAKTDHFPRDTESDLCPAGSYCPMGTPEPIHCKAGTYRDDMGAGCELDTDTDTNCCHPCPRGYFCPEETIDYEDNNCPVGYYCPSMTKSSDENPCPAGTYNPTPNAKGEAWCAVCPSGSYCPKGSSAPQECPAGYYCPEGLGEPSKCPVGTYSNQGGLSNIDECIQCPPGFFCDNLGMTNYTAECQAGSYCYGGSYRAQPEEVAIDPAEKEFIVNFTDRAVFKYYIQRLRNKKYKAVKIGGDCPAGSYCLQGSIVPVPCPEGKYGPSDTKGMIDSIKCKSCEPGHYCLGDGKPDQSGECFAGYYCVGGSNSPTQHKAGKGQYSLSGATKPLACPKGEFNKNEGQPSCPICSKGNFCPGYSTDGADDLGKYNNKFLNQTLTSVEVGTKSPYRCPEGTFCPKGTPYPKKCPPGTYSNRSNLFSESQCKPCKSGYMCAGWGIKWDGITTDLSTAPGVVECSEGSYCLEGMAYSSSFKKVSVIDIKWSLDGGSNYDFKIGENTDLSQSLSSFENNCIWTVQSLNSEYGQGYDESVCETYANTKMAPVCIAGHYCPKGSSIYLPCPAGKFLERTGGKSINECAVCTKGHACPTLGTSTPMKCAAGYYCTGGSKSLSPTPVVTDGVLTGTGNVCPGGHKCEKGCSKPVVCPNGTYSPTTGASDCIKCPPGYICNQNLEKDPGLTDPGSEVIDNGKYLLGCRTPVECGSRLGIGSLECAGGKCGGIYCVLGTGIPVSESPTGGEIQVKLCPAGTYSIATRLTSESECTMCPSGKFCVAGTITPEDCAEGYYCSSGCTNNICSSIYVPPSGSSGSTTVAHDGKCPLGHYCLEGTVNPTPCPAGTINNVAGMKNLDGCLGCPPGKYCGEGAFNTTTDTLVFGDVKFGYFSFGNATSSEPLTNPEGAFICEKGYYCPDPSTRYKCPRGTYMDERGSTTCKKCADGYICPQGSSYENVEACPKGSYCTNSFVNGGPISDGANYITVIPCPAGTYSNKKGLFESSQCVECPTSFYCSGTGNTKPTGICSKGYLCTKGSAESAPTGDSSSPNRICTLGKYCPAGASQEFNCPAGKLCGIVTDDPSLCPEGYYCEGANVKVPCSKGHYCPTGSPSPFGCPTGTYNGEEGKTKIEDCLICPKGFACETSALVNVVTECEAGYYCPGGNTSPRPHETTCPPGYMCPTGSSKGTICPNGTYSSSYGMAECAPCPAGYYCKLVGGDPIIYPKVCPYGFYCPEGTTEPKANVCPNGSFSWFEGLENSSQCVECPDGLFCKNQPGDEYTQIPEFTEEIMRKYGCPAGYNCKSGFSELNDGDLCPAGHYCPGMQSYPSSDFEPISCPLGTYSNSKGNIDVRDCTQCDDGRFCNATGLTKPSDEGCPDGWLCPKGSILKTPYNITQEGPIYDALYCPIGYACKNNVKKPCFGGYYSPTIGLSECVACPKGFVCDGDSNSPVVNLKACPEGYYCIEGSTSITKQKCASGSYSNLIGLTSQNDCLSCPRYMYCDGNDSVNPQYCSSGYLCLSGAKVSTPNDETGTKCPKGYYCPGIKNSIYVIPQPCPIGTFNDEVGLTEIGQCKKCPMGRYCPLIAMIESPDDYICDDGYFCPGGASSKTPYNDNNRECLEGSYCVGGVEKLCDEGTYQPNPKSSSCLTCPEGYYCGAKGLREPTICPKGYYCMAGTFNYVTQNYQCPEGTFNNQFGLTKIEDCFLCPYGMQCNNTAIIDPYEVYNADDKNVKNLENFKYICPKGYYCNHKLGISKIICPKGSYCPIGSMSPVPCPAGTYGDAEGMFECKECPLDRTCYEQGISDPNELKYLCPAGMWCRGGVDVQYLNNGVNSLYCIAGYKCEEGKPMVRCNNGFFSHKGSSQCITCPDGFFCNWDLVDYVRDTTDEDNYYGDPGDDIFRPYYPTKCPKNAYCPGGSILPKACSSGTFNNFENTEDSSYCTPCSPGSYCDALYDVNNVQSLSTKPTLTQVDFKNIIDFYRDNSAERRMPCPEGYYCRYGAYLKIKPDLVPYRNVIQCPNGYYCPLASDIPRPCPIGTYMKNNVLPLTGPGKSSIDSCVICPGGFYCDKKAALTVSGKCKAGYFCPEGSVYVTGSWSSNEIKEKYTGDPYDGTRCPQGHYCPEGSDKPIVCKFGYYASTYAMERCEICPNGFWCEAGTVLPEICEAGNLCKHDAIRDVHTKEACPNGSYNPSEGKYKDESCIPCQLGHYCVGGHSYSCPAGFYCMSSVARDFTGVVVPHPLGGTEYNLFIKTIPSDLIIYDYEHPGYYGNRKYILCPQGFFCEEGAESPSICESGKITTHPGATSIADCQPCPPGYLCFGSVIFSCPAGYYCPKNTAEDNFAAKELIAISEYLNDLKADDPELWKIVSKAYDISEITNDLSYNGVLPCPLGTYNNEFAGSSRNSCKMCEPGHKCNVVGLGGIEGYTCDPGYYCPGYLPPEGGQIQLKNEPSIYICPPGSYNASSGNTSKDNCQICPFNHYCPEGSIGPIECTKGHFCPVGSSEMQLCPLGTIYRFTDDESLNLNDINTICIQCPVGRYCDDPERLSSEECDPGYYCTGGSSIPNPGYDGGFNTGGRPCKEGYYCERGTAKPTPCPKGSYSTDEITTALIRKGDKAYTLTAACQICPPNTFNNFVGMNSCIHCGTTSYKKPIDIVVGEGMSEIDILRRRAANSVLCECVGLNRVFLTSSRTCACKQGYEYVEIVNGETVDLSNSDSSYDCIEKVFDNCLSRSQDGTCVQGTMNSDPSNIITIKSKELRNNIADSATSEVTPKATTGSTDSSSTRTKRCSVSCNQGLGVPFVTGGIEMCECVGFTDVGKIISSETVKPKITDLILDYENDVLNVYGVTEEEPTYSVLYSLSVKDNPLVAFDDQGRTTTVNTTVPVVVIDTFENSGSFRAIYNSFSYLQGATNKDANQTEESIYVLNPMVCIPVGGGVLLHSTDKNGAQNYFSYNPYSLFNTNAVYDNSKARDVSKADFALFTFSEPGVYAFTNTIGDKNSAKTTKGDGEEPVQTIVQPTLLVRVITPSFTCPSIDPTDMTRSDNIWPTSSQTHAKIGVSPTGNVAENETEIRAKVPLSSTAATAPKHTEFNAGLETESDVIQEYEPLPIISLVNKILSILIGVTMVVTAVCLVIYMSVRNPTYSRKDKSILINNDRFFYDFDLERRNMENTLNSSKKEVTIDIPVIRRLETEEGSTDASGQVKPTIQTYSIPFLPVTTSLALTPALLDAKLQSNAALFEDLINKFKPIRDKLEQSQQEKEVGEEGESEEEKKDEINLPVPLLKQLYDELTENTNKLIKFTEENISKESIEDEKNKALGLLSNEEKLKLLDNKQAKLNEIEMKYDLFKPRDMKAMYLKYIEEINTEVNKLRDDRKKVETFFNASSPLTNEISSDVLMVLNLLSRVAHEGFDSGGEAAKIVRTLLNTTEGDINRFRQLIKEGSLKMSNTLKRYHAYLLDKDGNLMVGFTDTFKQPNTNTNVQRVKSVYNLSVKNGSLFHPSPNGKLKVVYLDKELPIQSLLDAERELSPKTQVISISSTKLGKNLSTCPTVEINDDNYFLFTMINNSFEVFATHEKFLYSKHLNRLVQINDSLTGEFVENSVGVVDERDFITVINLSEGTKPGDKGSAAGTATRSTSGNSNIIYATPYTTVNKSAKINILSTNEEGTLRSTMFEEIYATKCDIDIGEESIKLSTSKTTAQEEGVDLDTNTLEVEEEEHTDDQKPKKLSKKKREEEELRTQEEEKKLISDLYNGSSIIPSFNLFYGMPILIKDAASLAQETETEEENGKGKRKDRKKDKGKIVEEEEEETNETPEEGFVAASVLDFVEHFNLDKEKARNSFLIIPLHSVKSDKFGIVSPNTNNSDNHHKGIQTIEQYNTGLEINPVEQTLPTIIERLIFASSNDFLSLMTESAGKAKEYLAQIERAFRDNSNEADSDSKSFNSGLDLMDVREQIKTSIDQLSDIDVLYTAKYRAFLNIKQNKALPKAVAQQNAINHSFSSKVNIGLASYAIDSNTLSAHTNIERSICSRELSKLKYTKLINLLESEEKDSESVDLNSELFLLNRNFVSDMLPFYSDVIESAELITTINKFFVNAQNYFMENISVILSQLILINNMSLNKKQEDYYMSVSTIISILANMDSLASDAANNLKRFVDTVNETSNLGSISSKLIGSNDNKRINYGKIFVHLMPTDITRDIEELRREISTLCQALTEINKANKSIGESGSGSDDSTIDISARAKAIDGLRSMLNSLRICSPTYSDRKTFIGVVSSMFATINSKILLLGSNLDSIRDVIGQMVVMQAMNPNNERKTYIDDKGQRKLLENRDKYVRHEDDEELEDKQDKQLLDEMKSVGSIMSELRICNALDEHGDLVISKETSPGEGGFASAFTSSDGSTGAAMMETTQPQQIFNDKEKQEMATLVDFLIGVSSTSENEDIAEIAKKALEKGQEGTKKQVEERPAGDTETLLSPSGSSTSQLPKDSFAAAAAREQEIEDQVREQHKELELDASSQASKLRAEIEQTQRNQKFEVLSVSDPVLVKNLTENQLEIKKLLDASAKGFVASMHELIDQQAEFAKKEAKRKAEIAHDENAAEQQKETLAKELEELEAEGELRDETELRAAEEEQAKHNEERLETLRTEHNNLINEYRRKLLEDDPNHNFDRDPNFQNLLKTQRNKETELENILNKEKSDQMAMLREKMRLKRLRQIKALEIKQLNTEKNQINKGHDNQQTLLETKIESETVQEFMNQQTESNNEVMKKLLQMEINFTNKLKRADDGQKKEIMQEYKNQVDKLKRELESDREKQERALRERIEQRKQNALKKNAKAAFNDVNRVSNTLALQEAEINDLELAEQRVIGSIQLANEMADIRVDSQVQAAIKARESISNYNKTQPGNAQSPTRRKLIIKASIKSNVFGGTDFNGDEFGTDEFGGDASSPTSPKGRTLSEAISNIVESYNADVDHVNSEIEASKNKQQEMLLERLRRRKENRMKQDERNKIVRNEEMKEQFKGVLDGNVIDKINGVKQRQPAAVAKGKGEYGSDDARGVDLMMDVEDDEASFDDPEEAFEKAEILKNVQNMISNAKKASAMATQVSVAQPQQMTVPSATQEAQTANTKAIEDLKAKLEAQTKLEQEKLEKQLLDEEEENMRIFNANREKLKKELEERVKSNAQSPKSASDVPNAAELDKQLDQVVAVFSAEQDRQQMQLKKMMERRKRMRLKKAKAEAEKRKEEQLQMKINSLKTGYAGGDASKQPQDEQLLTSQQENEVIRNTISNMDGASSAGNSFVVINVLKEKHYKQLKALEDTFEGDKQRLAEEAEDEVTTKYDELLNDLTQRQKQDIEALLNDDTLMGSSCRDVLENNLKTLSNQHEKEMNDLESQKEVEFEKTVQERIGKLTEDFNNNRKALLNKQMNEIFLKVQEVNKEFYKTSTKAANELIERKKIEMELEKRNLLLEKRLKHKEMLMEKRKERERLKLEKKKKFEEEKDRIIKESQQKEQGLITNLLKFQIEQSEIKTIQENMKNEMRKQQEANKMKAESLLATVANTAEETTTQVEDELSRQMARMKESIKQRTAQRIRAEKEKLMKEVEESTRGGGEGKEKTIEEMQSTTDAIADRIAKLKQEYYKLNQIIKERKGEESSDDEKEAKVGRVGIDTDLGLGNKAERDNDVDSDLSDIEDSLDQLIHSEDQDEANKNLANLLGETPQTPKQDLLKQKQTEQVDEDTAKLLGISEQLDNINRHTKELIEMADGVLKESQKGDKDKGESPVVNNNWMVKENATRDSVIKVALTPAQWTSLMGGKSRASGDKGKGGGGVWKTISKLSRQVSKQMLMAISKNRDIQIKQEPTVPVQSIMAEGIRKTLNNAFQLLIKTRIGASSNSTQTGAGTLTDNSFIEIEFVEAGRHKKIGANKKCPYADLYTYRKDVQTLYLSSVLIEPQTMSDLGLIAKVDLQETELPTSMSSSPREMDFTKEYSVDGHTFDNLFTSSLSIALHCLAHSVADADEDEDTLFQGALVSTSVASTSLGNVFKDTSKQKK